MVIRILKKRTGNPDVRFIPLEMTPAELEKRAGAAEAENVFIDDTPAPKTVTATEFLDKVPYADLPLAKSLEELQANLGKMRGPAPTTCKLCGNVYTFPCDGKNPKCMGVIWHNEQKGKKK